MSKKGKNKKGTAAKKRAAVRRVVKRTIKACKAGKGKDMGIWQKINGRYVQSDEATTEDIDGLDYSDDPAVVNNAIAAELKRDERKVTSTKAQAALDYRTDRDDYGMTYSGGSKSWGGKFGYGYRHCEHDGEQVFRINETVYGGGKQSKLDICEMDVILDASGQKFDGTAARPFITSTSELWNTINKYIEQPAEHVRLNWPDQKAPPVRYEAWPEILKITQEYGYVVACCMGGHGRTGTILAALLIAAGRTAKDALKIIRGHYCNQAVETQTQEVYLDGLEAWMRANNLEPEYTIEILAEPVKEHDSKHGEDTTRRALPA